MYPYSERRRLRQRKGLLIAQRETYALSSDQNYDTIACGKRPKETETLYSALWSKLNSVVKIYILTIGGNPLARQEFDRDYSSPQVDARFDMPILVVVGRREVHVCSLCRSRELCAI